MRAPPQLDQIFGELGLLGGEFLRLGKPAAHDRGDHVAGLAHFARDAGGAVGALFVDQPGQRPAADIEQLEHVLGELLGILDGIGHLADAGVCAFLSAMFSPVAHSAAL